MTEQQEQQADNKPSANKPTHWIGKISLIVALVSMVIALYSTHLNRHLQQDNGQLSDEIVQLQHQQQNLSQHLKENQDGWQLKQQQFNQDLQAVSQRLQDSLAEKHFDQKDWMLQKARFCLELAQINAHWSSNHPTTLALLQQADLILSHLQGSEIYAVRQAIAKEISTIQSIPSIDQAGLLSQLDAAAQQVNLLPVLLLSNQDKANSETNPAVNKQPSAWREKLHDSVHMLEKLVVVRHHDQDFQPMLSPMYQAVVRQSIRMDLQQAQWAILQSNNAVYQLGLKQAHEQIKHSFDSQAKPTQTLLTQLTQLQAINIHSQAPHFDQSLSLIDQVIQKSQKQPAAQEEVSHD